jgi:hypothetical protein
MPKKLAVAGFTVALVAALALPAAAQFPYPTPPTDPYDYTQLHITNGDCSTGVKPADLPASFNCKTDFKFTNYRPHPGDRDYDPVVENNPQELFGVKGPNTNRAWEITTGRPDTVISVLDSGILWNEDNPQLVNKLYLNRGELPVPCSAAVATDCTTSFGTTLQDYDVTGDGVFNVKDYGADPRAHDFPDDMNDILDPGDLIRIFSDGLDQDGNGYTDDISGYDFFEHDNDPQDDVSYGHGTGEANDSTAEVDVAGRISQCPNCMVMPLRVGDSFIADINRFAEAVVYATDNGASVVQEALGTLNHTGFAQTAVDYAYHRGVIVVASEADESAGHHNYPAALNHTMVVNSSTHYAQQGGVPLQSPLSYVEFNGCTNFGGYTWSFIESSSCSSDATGQSSGQMGLLYSAARNAIAKGKIAESPTGRPLSAEEAKQLFRVVSSDIDFATPRCGVAPDGQGGGCGKANNFDRQDPVPSQRFVTTPGWDQITGWGRPNVNDAVRLIMDGKIPPEPDITAPRWWRPLKTSGTVDIVGSVGAPRAPSYAYELQYAAHVQPPFYPFQETWHTFATGAGTAPMTGVLGTLDLGQVHEDIANAPPDYLEKPPFTDPTSPQHPEKNAFRVRLVVCAGVAKCPDETESALDHDPTVGIEQRQYFSFDRGTLKAYPRYLNADGAGSPAFEDITGDGHDEMIISDGNGYVHAYRTNGSEAPGWPVHTDPIALPASGNNAFTRGDVATPVYAPVLLGSPTVADLNRDGRLEVSVAALDGKLYVWNFRGVPRSGFPVAINPDYSVEPPCNQPGAIPYCDDYTGSSPDPSVHHDVRNDLYKPFHGFTVNPAAGNLDPSHAGLELVVGAGDTHVYAWHADGTPVPGWPVLIGDPTKIASVDPVTHEITYTDPSSVEPGGKIVGGVSLGDVDGNGDLEVAVNVNEEYSEPPNWSSRNTELQALAAIAKPGNTRVYLLHHEGTLRDPHDGSAETANPDDQAYVHGWPVKIGMVTTELLPDVGEGSNGAPVLADVDGDGKLEVGTASIGSPPYLLRADGTSYYGEGDGGYNTMSSSRSEFKSDANDGPSIASIGGGAFGDIGTGGLSFAMGSTGLDRLLDVVLPEQQYLAEDHIGSWNAESGTYDPGFPAQMNDLMFFNTPAIMDVSGDGNAEVLQSSAMYDLQAYGAGSDQVPTATVPAGWPKFTGGWSVATPGAGDLNGDRKLDVALVSREGWLFVWPTQGAACQPTQWPKYQHDLWNTGTYGTDARDPSAVRRLSAWRAKGSVMVRWRAPGDDGRCGQATRYVVQLNRGTLHVPFDVPAPTPAGTKQLISIPDSGKQLRRVTVQAIDDVGNKGFYLSVPVKQ